MTMHEASRTLVKSTPELWAECSDGESLSRHLGAFGEIRITKLEPETAVAWEGDDVRGTVTLEPSGWGTRVVLTATLEGAEPSPAPPAASATTAPPEPESAVEPAVAVAEPEPEPEPVAEPVAVAEPEPQPDPVPEPEPKRPGFFARLFGFQRKPRPEAAPLGDEDPLIGLAGGGQSTSGGSAESTPEPDPAPEPTTVPELEGTLTVTDERSAPELEPSAEEPASESDPKPTDVLVGALDSLGTAHKRPFSRG